MEQLIGIGIQPHPDMNRADLQKLADLSMIYSEIQDAFIKGEITPDDYLELLAEHGVAMDQYCDQTTHNLQQVGLIL